MTITRMSLVDGEREMLLLPRPGLRVQKLSAPMPSIREVTEPYTDDDGDRDTTSLYGSRAVSVELFVENGARAVEDELALYLNPRSRPYLVVTDNEWAQDRRLRLRADQFDSPLGVDLPRRMRNIQLGWKAPDGVWEASETAEVTLNADLPTGVGRTYPRSHPWHYVGTLASGAGQITNPGTMPSHFTARLYGPCSGPRLLNVTTGQQLAFNESLILAAGEYVEVSTRDHTAYLLSMSDASRLNFVDFTITTWFQVQPGLQNIRYAPPDASAGAVAVITYRPAWL